MSIAQTHTWNALDSAITKNVQSCPQLQVMQKCGNQLEIGHEGMCKVTKAKLCLKLDAQPVFGKKRPVQFMHIARLDEEISMLEGEGIITKVDYSK